MSQSRSSTFITLGAAALLTAVAVASRERRHRATREKLEKEIAELQATGESGGSRSVGLPISSSSKSTDTRKNVTLEDAASVSESGLTVKPIGLIRSVYRLCVGTPRQGLLAPDARGRVEMAYPDAVDGLEGYSHVWIVFVFHLNTQSQAPNRVKCKVAPPALGGDKVGILATRTPHRFNPVGITLCRLDRIEKVKNSVILHLSGLDLVDGTPVLDIKPYVPVYDTVADDCVLRLPAWVSDGLKTKRKVTITKLARDELRSSLVKHPDALEFYGPKVNENSLEETLERVLGCIAQVLSMDVRSSWQTDKARSGKFQAERSSRIQASDDTTELANQDIPAWCTQQIDNLLVSFSVEESTAPNRSESDGSGAEDVVFVKTIQLIKVPAGGTKLEWNDVPKDIADSWDKIDIAESQTDAAVTSDMVAQQRSTHAASPEADPSHPSYKDMEKQPEFAALEYKVLKTYWDAAGKVNTPRGLTPETVQSPVAPAKQGVTKASHATAKTEVIDNLSIPMSEDRPAQVKAATITDEKVNEEREIGDSDSPATPGSKADASTIEIKSAGEKDTKVDSVTIGGFRVARKAEKLPAEEKVQDSDDGQFEEKTTSEPATAVSGDPQTDNMDSDLQETRSSENVATEEKSPSTESPNSSNSGSWIAVGDAPGLPSSQNQEESSEKAEGHSGPQKKSIPDYSLEVDSAPAESLEANDAINSESIAASGKEKSAEILVGSKYADAVPEAPDAAQDDTPSGQEIDNGNVTDGKEEESVPKGSSDGVFQHSENNAGSETPMTTDSAPSSVGNLEVPSVEEKAQDEEEVAKVDLHDTSRMEEAPAPQSTVEGSMILVDEQPKDQSFESETQTTTQAKEPSSAPTKTPSPSKGVECKVCHQTKPKSAFSNSQLKKKTYKCMECVKQVSSQ